jgi:predicted nucleotidyltransferase
MVSRIELLSREKLINPPKWLSDNTHYEVITGSVAYGVSNDTSDMDVLGFCIPPKADIFPHLKGEIPGFGHQHQRFSQFQQHHIQHNDTNYDLTIYSIVKFFQLCMENNPNMVDTLFVPQRCVLFCSPIAQIVRDNRRLFLHKGSYHKFRGYAYSQLHKIGTKANASNPVRRSSIEAYGYDVKFAYHVVRLALECEQILVEHDLDLERNREVLKSIRRGEWSLEKLKDWFNRREAILDELYTKSTLQIAPDEAEIRDILLRCLEQHYGSLSAVISKQTNDTALLADLKELIRRYT